LSNDFSNLTPSTPDSGDASFVAADPAGRSETPETDDSSEPATQPAPNPFAALGLGSELVQRLAKLKYEAPTPIQVEAIPALLSGRDLVGQAATGTGKTAAFALPMITSFLRRPAANPAAKAPAAPTKGRIKSSRQPFGLVLVPTRELAMQAVAAIQEYSASQDVRVLAIFGGQSYDIQLRALDRGVDIVVATPGRAMDHIDRRTLDLSQISMVVLDEADEMLAMGFIEDIEKILGGLPEKRQTALFSATMPERIANVARKFLNNPMRIAIAKPKVSEDEVASVRQNAYIMPRAHKKEALCRILDFEVPTAAIVFCRTRNETDDVTTGLNSRGHRAEALHGGMAQAQRDRVMKNLREGSTKIVVATDIAARGLDIDHLSHVINFDMPESPETYVHRIGRVGRAGRTGMAITLAEPRHRFLMRDLERITKQPIWPTNVPALADVEAKRTQALGETIRKILAATNINLDVYRAAIASLTSGAEPLNVVDVAAAAILMAGGPVERAVAADAGAGALGGNPRKGPMAALRLDGGRIDGVTARDVVGAIAGEAKIDGRDIGTIHIDDRASLVEIRADLVDTVLDRVRQVEIRGVSFALRKHNGPVPSRLEASRGRANDRDGVRPRYAGNRPSMGRGEFRGRDQARQGRFVPRAKSGPRGRSPSFSN